MLLNLSIIVLSLLMVRSFLLLLLLSILILRIPQTGKEKLNSKIAEYYTDESKFELSKGFYDSYIDLRNEYFFKCPNYFYSNYASMNADKVYNYLISYRPTLHFESAVYRLDEKLNLSSYSWIGFI